MKSDIQTLQRYERITFPETRAIPLNLKCPHSKALELDCLFRPFKPPTYMTQSPEGEGGFVAFIF